MVNWKPEDWTKPKAQVCDIWQRRTDAAREPRTYLESSILTPYQSMVKVVSPCKPHYAGMVGRPGAGPRIFHRSPQ